MNCVPFEAFEYVMSFIGAFFFVKGINMIWKHDQSMMVKMFLHEYGFGNATPDGANIFDIWHPIYIAIAVFVLTIISGIYKRY